MGTCCSKKDTELLKTSSESLNEPSGSSTPQVEVASPNANESSEVDTETVAVAPSVLRINLPFCLPLTRIIFSPASERHQCAYCNNPNGDLYDYFHVVSTLSCTLYEEFMENGWWRTGKLLFRPRFDIVCCPGYATRLPVEEYVLTKKHRRVIKKWGAFLRNGASEWNQRKAIYNENAQICVEETKTGNSMATDNIEPTKMKNSKPKPKKVVEPGLGPDPAKPLCKKSKVRKVERLKNKEVVSPPTPQTNPISLIELIEQEITATTASLKHNFEVKLVPCSPTSLQSTNQRAYDLYEKLQEKVHIGKTRFESFDQFIWGFSNSCLPSEANQGSFHLQYFLDSELIMYSIVDITPHYFVSIYFVYEPDLRFLSPGIFTCLYEMSLVLRLKQTLPNMKYYGLGYYNHFDNKALYKKQFKPQQVLCNETNIFVSLDSAIPKFLAQKYCQLADSSIPVKEGRNASIDTIVISMGQFLSGQFGTLPGKYQEKYRDSQKQFVCEAGYKVARQCNVDFLSNYT